MRVFRTREQIKARCRTFSTPLVSQNESKILFTSARFPCKNWRCPDCSKTKARAVAVMVGHHFNGERVRHLVLTFDPSRTSVRRSYENSPHCFNRFISALRKHKPKLKYFKILESQKSGMCHLHILINTYIPKHWITTEATRVGFGRINHISSVGTDAQRAYVFKYLAKGLGNENAEHLVWELRKRRWSASSHPELYPVAKKSFTRLAVSFCASLADSICSNYVAVLVKKGAIISNVTSHTSGGFSVELSGFPDQPLDSLLGSVRFPLPSSPPSCSERTRNFALPLFLPVAVLPVSPPGILR